MKTLTVVLVLIANITYYDPALCSSSPINCFDPLNPFRMAAGHDARAWYGEALACPAEFPIGSTWRLPGIAGQAYTPPRDWLCLDRGGRIRSRVLSDGTIQVALDLLSSYAIVSKTVRVEYIGPAPVSLLAHAQAVAESCANGRPDGADKNRC